MRMLKPALLVLGLLLVTCPTWAAIGFDNAGSNQCATCGATLSVTLTVGAGLSNSIALCFIDEFSSTAAPTATFGGSAMTQIRTDVGTGGAASFRNTEFRLLSPPSGSQTCTVTMTGTTDAVLGVVTLSGVDQTTPVDASNFNSLFTSSPGSVTVTTVADNAWIVDNIGFADTSATMVAHTGRTQRWNLSTAGGVIAAGSTYGPITPAGATVADWTLGGAPTGIITGVSFKPASGGAAPAGVNKQRKLEMIDPMEAKGVSVGN